MVAYIVQSLYQSKTMGLIKITASQSQYADKQMAKKERDRLANLHPEKQYCVSKVERSVPLNHDFSHADSLTEYLGGYIKD